MRFSQVFPGEADICTGVLFYSCNLFLAGVSSGRLFMDVQRPIRFVTLKHRLIVFGITILGVGLLGGVGYFLDRYFETRPLFLIIGVILSFPLVQLAIVRQLRVK